VHPRDGLEIAPCGDAPAQVGKSLLASLCQRSVTCLLSKAISRPKAAGALHRAIAPHWGNLRSLKGRFASELLNCKVRPDFTRSRNLWQWERLYHRWLIILEKITDPRPGEPGLSIGQCSCHDDCGVIRGADDFVAITKLLILRRNGLAKNFWTCLPGVPSA